MKTKANLIKILVVLGFAGVATASVFLLRGSSFGEAAFWQQQVSPGNLSAAHSFLQTNCAACHTPVEGVQAANCIVCHANNVELLARQPTAFHANIQSCSACHVEHQGADRRPTSMDHAALAEIGLSELGSDRSDAEKIQARDQLVSWIRTQGSAERAVPAHAELTTAEMSLNCASCHSTKDKHLGLLGQSCATCHSTSEWTIPAFQHPSPRSTDCSQCHQAPPSHYMMHFEMVDKKIAARDNAKGDGCCESVKVNQCYACHQTTSWNDIKGVGFYKHH